MIRSMGPEAQSNRTEEVFLVSVPYANVEKLRPLYGSAYN